MARATARGATWSYGTFLASKGVMLLATLVLARLLVPEDFGLMTLAFVFVNALEVINDFGIDNAVIWRKGDEDETSDIAFVMTMAIGVVLTVVVLFSAPMVADAFGEPRVAPMIAVLSITFLITSLGSVQNARLRRDLEFDRRFVAELSKAVVKAGVTVVLAVAGLGAWAFVYGHVAGVAVGSMFYWVLARWRPHLRFDREVARPLLRYGGQIAIFGVLAAVASNIDYVIVGRRLGTEALGYYTIAFRLPALLIITSCAVLSQVFFPAFTKVSRDNGSLVPAFLSTVRAVVAFIVPVGAGIALVSSDLVEVLFGERWMTAVPVMRWLAVFAVVSTLLYTDGDVYKATGRPMVLTAITSIRLLVSVVVLWWAAGYSIETVAMGQVGVAAVVLLVRIVAVDRLIGVRPVELLRAVRPVVLGAAALVVVVASLQAALNDVATSVRLLASVLAGGAAYAGGLIVVDRRWVMDILRLFGLGRRRLDPRQAPAEAPATTSAVSAAP